jgi:hypothetical protein
MNTRAKCINTSCKLYDVEKSVAVGTLTGYGAANDRVKCPECGKLMRDDENPGDHRPRDEKDEDAAPALQTR